MDDAETVQTDVIVTGTGDCESRYQSKLQNSSLPELVSGSWERTDKSGEWLCWRQISSRVRRVSIRQRMYDVL
jgi:hypothetical protein